MGFEAVVALVSWFWLVLKVVFECFVVSTVGSSLLVGRDVLCRNS